MTEIYKLLPDIILYIVFGYVFLKFYRLVRVIEKPIEQENVFIESIVVGFIIKNIASIIPFSLGYYIDIVFITISSGIIGFVIGKIVNSKFVDKIMFRLNIRHDKYKYLWQNITDPELAIYIDATNPDTNIRYFGRIVRYEDYTRLPIIQISNYKCWVDDALYYDCSDDYTRTMLIDTSQYSEIGIEYQEASEFAKEWKQK